MVGLSRIPGIEAQAVTPELSSNLVRIGPFFCSLRTGPFLRELFESIELSTPCQGESLLTDSIPFLGMAQRKISKNDQRKAQVRLGGRAEGSSSGSCNGLFSLGIPYRGPGKLACLTTQRTGLPNLPFRAGLEISSSPPESPTAHLQLSKSSTGHSSLQGR